MQVTCPKCKSEYDDAQCFTFCPHQMFMSRVDLERKIAALELIGKDVRFNHLTDNDKFRIRGVTWDGMVLIDAYPGEFAPHLFTVVPQETDNQ